MAYNSIKANDTTRGYVNLRKDVDTIMGGGYATTTAMVAADAVVTAATDAKLITCTQTDVTASRAIDGTVYQNTSGKLMVATVTMSFTTTQSGSAYCDSANPPTTVIGVFGQTGATTVYEHITFIIQPNHYYKITVNGTKQTWIEWTLF